MHVCVNDRPVSVSAGDGRTVEDILNSLRRRGEIRESQAVVALAVDGRPWTGADLDAAGRAELGEDARIAVHTAGVADCAQRALRDAGGMLDVLTEAAVAVAVRFRESPAEEANARLYDLLEALHRFLGFLHRLQNTCSPAYRPLDDDAGPLAAVADALQTVQERQETQDWAGLADALEDALAPALGVFAPVLERMAREVQT